jgi:hypothetical protein
MSDVLLLAGYFGLILLPLAIVGGGIMVVLMLSNRPDRPQAAEPAKAESRQRRQPHRRGGLLHH